MRGGITSFLPSKGPQEPTRSLEAAEDKEGWLGSPVQLHLTHLMLREGLLSC